MIVAAPIQQASAEPTDEEVEAWKANVEAEGFEPSLVRIQIRSADW